MQENSMRKRSRFEVSDEEKAQLFELAKRINEAEGIVLTERVLAEEIQRRMVAEGLNPEDRVFTRE